MSNLTKPPRSTATVPLDSTNAFTMADRHNEPKSSEPPPDRNPNVTYNNPRRTSPEKSITLRHHREAARRRTPPGSSIPQINITNSPLSPRRNSSDESNETGYSDPKKWFDQSNTHANASGPLMDLDSPFYQRETDSSNEGHPMPSQSPAYRILQNRNPALLRPGLTHSSSADDYRSVIDDLTIENKKLKEQLKRYKQMGPDSMRKEKLFEVKVHGLPSRKRRELENTLRDFTTSLDGSEAAISEARKKGKAKSKWVNSLASKHASSSSGSNSRPQAADSGYHSMSTGVNSSDPSVPGRLQRQRSSNQAVETFLREVPEGLWPRSLVLTEKDKKKLVVRRLEQLFTGKAWGHNAKQPPLPLVPSIVEDVEMSNASEESIPPQPPALPHPPSEANREAKMLPRSRERLDSVRSRDHITSGSGSNYDQNDSRDAVTGSNSGGGESGRKSNDASPPNLQSSEQRATRPRDLDPDRIQVPADNMDYIRHLGIPGPESQLQFSAGDVRQDADGWVYLNLLSNMAQLHILNVTPDFIRSAVTEKSTHFQLSSDGRKIRWRGGGEGTRFSSDNSSGNTSQRENSSEEGQTDGSNDLDQRKKQKIDSASKDAMISEPSKLDHRVSTSSDSFHYKPLFVHQQSSASDEQPSVDEDSQSSYGAVEESNFGVNLRWGPSATSMGALPPHRKRRRDGAIIYYTGAPFCTDLSGDSEMSAENMTSSLDQLGQSQGRAAGVNLQRSASDSSIPFKPLSNYVSHRAMMDLDFAPPELTPDSDCPVELKAEFPWSAEPQTTRLTILEASGLGGITPDDHFVVNVSTRRPKMSDGNSPRRPLLTAEESQDTMDTMTSKDTTESVAGKLAAMTTASPIAPTRQEASNTGIVYVSGRIRRLPPNPLPPPTFFFNYEDNMLSDSDDDSDCESDEQGVTTARLMLHQAQAPIMHNGYMSGDEADETSDEAAESDEREESLSPENLGKLGGSVGGLRSARIPDLTTKVVTGSSVATAGGAVSAYSSMDEA